jgi:hypothetical protein
MTQTIALLALLVLGGCAVGNKHQYDAAMPQINASSGGKAGVGAQDRRAYVLNGDKVETFVGLSRGGFGNPFDVKTESGQPLADEFGKAIQRALAGKGVTATAVRLEPKLGEPRP